MFALSQPLSMEYKVSPSKTDQELMELVQNRSEDAFEELVQRHFDRVYRFIFRMSGSADDAEDITQETFFRVWNRGSSWKPNRVQFATWLHQIARNLYIDSTRKRQPVLKNLDEEVSIVSSEDPVTDALNDSDAGYLREAIQNLPERQRTALLLCQIQGWTVAEAAEVLDSTVYAVDALLGRAKRHLRQILKERIAK